MKFHGIIRNLFRGSCLRVFLHKEIHSGLQRKNYFFNPKTIGLRRESNGSPIGHLRLQMICMGFGITWCFVLPHPSPPQPFTPSKNFKKRRKSEQQPSKSNPDLLYFLGMYCTIFEILRKFTLVVKPIFASQVEQSKARKANPKAIQRQPQEHSSF